MTVRTTCRARQHSDQMLCPCGLGWDVNDPDPPRCPCDEPPADKETRRMEIGKRTLANIRRMLARKGAK